MNRNTFAIVLFSSAALVGCASKPTAESMQKDQIKANELRAAAEASQSEKRQVRNEAYLEGIPQWALQPPKPDAGGMYAVGSGESQSLSVAQKKAMLDAEFGLAKQYRQELSGSERSYTQERNDQSLSSQYTQLIDKLVTRVPVVGFEVVKQEVKSMHGTFHSWILLKLPYAQFNQVLQEQRADAVDTTVQKAFDEFDQRLKERAAQRMQESREQQALRQTEVATQASIAGQIEGTKPQVGPATPGTDLPINLPRGQVTPVDATGANRSLQ